MNSNRMTKKTNIVRGISLKKKRFAASKCLVVASLGLFVGLFQTNSYADMVGQWVADDWAGGTTEWVDRVMGKMATVPSAINSPIKTVGAIEGSLTSSGIVFDGVNDYFLIHPFDNPIQGKTSVTIVAFFNTSQGASGSDGAFWRFPGPINGEGPGGPNDWGLTYNAAGNAQGFFNSRINPSPSVSLIDGQPHTMTLTWQDPSVFPGEGVARLYVDGNLVGSVGPTDGGNGVNNANGFVIGADREGILYNFPRFFSGAIGELRFYDSVEDPEAIHAEVINFVDTDTDADSVGDATDNCPLDANPLQENNDGDALGDICDPDDDNDGTFDIADNCPITSNLDQSDDDFDGLGNACDTSYDVSSVAQHLEDVASGTVTALTNLNVSGGNGMISKLTGNGGVTRKVANTVAAYEVGAIDTATYLSDLETALSKLTAFDNQLNAKIGNGKIVEPDASIILAASAELRATINGLIVSAGG